MLTWILFLMLLGRTGMVQEILDNLRKVADQLEEDKWMYQTTEER